MTAKLLEEEIEVEQDPYRRAIESLYEVSTAVQVVFLTLSLVAFAAQVAVRDPQLYVEGIVRNAYKVDVEETLLEIMEREMSDLVSPEVELDHIIKPEDKSKPLENDDVMSHMLFVRLACFNSLMHGCLPKD